MLFVYGTLQDPDVLAAILGRPVDMTSLTPAIAPGYRAVAYPGRVYPALIVAPAGRARGHVIDGLTELDMAVLDAFEGEEYDRRTIAVEIDGSVLSAHAYIPVIAVAAEGNDWDLAAWTTQHKPTVIGTETGTARAMRERLSARIPH